MEEKAHIEEMPKQKKKRKDRGIKACAIISAILYIATSLFLLIFSTAMLTDIATMEPTPENSVDEISLSIGLYIVFMIIFCAIALIPYIISTVFGATAWGLSGKKYPRGVGRRKKVITAILTLLPIPTDVIFLLTIFIAQSMK